MPTKKQPTPESTAEQLPDSSPTTTEAPAKPAKKTAAQTRQELEDLKQVSAARMIRIRNLEVTAQKARDVLKSEGTPGMTMTQDHFRLKGMVDELRKILDVKPEQIGG